ncbi:hypothetical protein D9M73_237210 [compost metagenome]
MLLASTSTLSFSSITGCTPMRPNSSIMVVMSCRCGRLPTVTGVSASRVAARIGRAAFFAPEMRISPSRGEPPVMISLSMAMISPRAQERSAQAARLKNFMVTAWMLPSAIQGFSWA